jgi:hypothetical protein
MLLSMLAELPPLLHGAGARLLAALANANVIHYVIHCWNVKEGSTLPLRQHQLIHQELIHGGWLLCRTLVARHGRFAQGDMLQQMVAVKVAGVVTLQIFIVEN